MKIFFFFILCTFGFLESSGGLKATPEAFIFSLNNNERLAPFVSKVRGPHGTWAIFRGSQYGPCFDKAGVCYHKTNYKLHRARLGSVYSVPPEVLDPLTVLAGTDIFSPDEVEVFYLDPSR